MSIEPLKDESLKDPRFPLGCGFFKGSNFTDSIDIDQWLSKGNHPVCAAKNAAQPPLLFDEEGMCWTHRTLLPQLRKSERIQSDVAMSRAVFPLPSLSVGFAPFLSSSSRRMIFRCWSMASGV